MPVTPLQTVHRGRRSPPPNREAFPHVLFVSTVQLPTAYPSLRALARGLHRRRAGRAIQCVTTTVAFSGELAGRVVVAVYTLGEDGQRAEQLGLAWVAGQGREVLEAALAAEQPQTVHREAA